MKDADGNDDLDGKELVLNKITPIVSITNVDQANLNNWDLMSSEKMNNPEDGRDAESRSIHFDSQ